MQLLAGDGVRCRVLGRRRPRQLLAREAPGPHREARAVESAAGTGAAARIPASDLRRCRAGGDVSSHAATQEADRAERKNGEGDGRKDAATVLGDRARLVGGTQGMHGPPL